MSDSINLSDKQKLYLIESMISKAGGLFGKVYGEYCREKVLKEIVDPTWQPIMDNIDKIDLWFMWSVRADEFVERMGKDLVLIGPGKYHLVNSNDEIVTTVTITVSDELQVDDFEVHKIIYWGKGTLGNCSENFLDQIKTKTLTVLPIYWKRLKLRDRETIKNLIKIFRKGWKIKLPSGNIYCDISELQDYIMKFQGLKSFDITEPNVSDDSIIDRLNSLEKKVNLILNKLNL